MDTTLATRVVVRVLGDDGLPVGAGFLVGPDVVATCAHVVASAVGGDAFGPSAPRGPVRLDFPMFRGAGAEQAVAAVADVREWHPIGPDGSGDIALLTLREPPPSGARMPPLRRVDRLWGHEFRVLGFPDGMADGVWATGAIRGEQGLRWFQLQAAVGDQAIVEGFSGSPVWDDESGAVVGMTVASDATGSSTTAYLIPIDQVIGIDPALLPCPYRGLRPFGEEHAAYFFGRERDIARLVDLIDREPLVAVAGPSGAGKSSLVRAGLLPRLRAAGDLVAELRPAPRSRPEAALVDAIASVVAGATVPGDGDASVSELVASIGDARVLLVVDQFEELAAADPEGAQRLVALIGELIGEAAGGERPAVRAVLTLRSATLDTVLAPGTVDMLGTGTMLLAPMERGQLRDAIVAPAERAPGLSFEAGLVDRILDDAAAEPGQLPLVESLLTELWERREGGHLTVDAYERAGGVAGVVATHAEEVVGRFTDPADEGRLRRLFTSLATSDRDGRFVRRPVPLAELAPDLLPLLPPLTDGRLVVVERGPRGEDLVQLAHQALIAHWPRLHDWLAEDRDFLTWRAQLDQQRERWDDGGRDDGALLRGAALAAAQDWLPRRTADVAPATHDYVRRSTARQRREVRRWRTVTAVLAILVLAAAGLSAVAVARGNEVTEQLRLANAEVMGQAALGRQLTDPVAATALALTAWRADPENSAARNAMARLALGMRSVDQVIPDVVDQAIIAFGTNGDGDTIVVQNGPGVRVLTGTRGAAVQSWDLPETPGGFTKYLVTPDGRTVITSGTTGVVSVWDVANRTGPVEVGGAAGLAMAETLSISADGTKVYWLTRPVAGAIQLVIWDLAANAAVPHGLGPLASRDIDLDSIAMTVDPQVVIITSATADGTPTGAVARSLVDGATIATVPPGVLVDVGSGSQILACVEGAPSQAVLWDPLTGREVRRIDLLADCSPAYLKDHLTADYSHLLETRTRVRDRDSDDARITSIEDSRTFDLTSPPSAATTVTPTMASSSSSAAGTSFILPADTAADRIDVLVPRGRSVLRLHAVSDVTGMEPTVQAVGLSADGRYEVVLSRDRYTVRARGTRQVIATLPKSQLADQGELGQSLEGNELGILTKAADHWSYAEYAIPSLSLIARYPVPIPTDLSILQLMLAMAVSPDRVATITEGVLLVWNRRTGERVGKPINLATDGFRADYFKTRQELALGPTGQVAVVGPDAIEFWDPVAGSRIGEIRPEPSGTYPTLITMNPSGTLFATVAIDFSVQVWDFDRRVPVGERLELPTLGYVKAFTDDGNLAIMQEAGDGSFQLVFWDWRTGRQGATLRVAEPHDLSNFTAADGRHYVLNGQGTALPVLLPLNARDWFDQLCRITDRPFTPAERELLPAEVDDERPCG
ncbi:trypsin-like peptidase domain-containing protein [Pseudonocardia sp. DSM 110487]|uniref:nSTAND1 domain-containing NTPase n=1 Tax=Pseudonocardia sp. DSM 110487 TaxID=2865833 RepID=UPI001C6A2852|nr:trypsin-like peptidase domain-containing protein [Pseudonocardia sp. DSM 110487]QYN32487.1 trypsin-like peptidase domain-containing protein [Pseudonocardia sp. DSM 110487]